MDKKNAVLSILILGILVSSACVLTIPVPGFSPAAPAVNTLAEISPTEQPQEILPTFTLIFTETLAPTLTPSFTPIIFPTITPFPTATLTPSITPSPIPVEISTLSGDIPQGTLTQIALTPLSSGDPIGSEFACLVTAKRVADFTVFKPKYQFTAWWDLKNVGQKKWNQEVVVAYLVDGMRMSPDRYQNLPAEPRPGESVRLKIEMKTPPEEGTYMMTWGLRNMRTKRYFCFFTINIIVKK